MAYKKKSELALELIHLTHSWTDRDRLIRVVTDLSYCCETVIKGRPRGTHITGRIRKDSALYELSHESIVRGRGRPRKKGRRMPAPAALFQDPTLQWQEIHIGSGPRALIRQVYTFTAIWYHAVGNEPLRFVLSRDLSGTYADTVFVDTDLDATPDEIIARYAARSSIEVTNRETKEFLGAADPQCRSEQSVARAPLFAYWAYSLVVLWFVRHFHTARLFVADPGPWYRHKKNFSFSDMLAAARRSHFNLVFMKEACQHGTSLKIKAARSTRQRRHAGNAKL
jgi:hypothetical protein